MGYSGKTTIDALQCVPGNSEVPATSLTSSSTISGDHYDSSGDLTYALTIHGWYIASILNINLVKITLVLVGICKHILHIGIQLNSYKLNDA